MAISLKSATTGTDNGGSATVTVVTSESPTATAIGDLVVVVHGNDFYALSNMPTPTATGSPTLTAITDTGVPVDAGTNQAHIKGWWYVANTAGAQTISAVETGTHDEEKSMTAVVLGAADTSSPIDDAAGNFATSASQVANGITAGPADDFLIIVVNSGTGAASASYTTPGPLTEQHEFHVSTVYSGVVATAQLSAAGATGNFTFTAASSIPYGAVTIAVKTASAAASGGGRPVTPGRTWQRRYRHRQTWPATSQDVTQLPLILPIVVVGATPTPVAQAPILGRGSLFDAATPRPLVVNPQRQANAGQVLLGRGSLADDPVLTTRAPVVTVGLAAAVVTQPAFLARSSLADAAAITAATPAPIVVAAPPQRAATPQAFIGRSSLADAATPPPIVNTATTQRPAGTVRVLRATLADDAVLTTRTPVVVTGAAATVVTPAPFTARSSLVDVAPSTIATPQPIIITPPARLPMAPAPIIDRGALQDDPQLTTPPPVVTAAPLRIPVIAQAFLTRSSLADVVASSTATPQPIVVIGPVAPRAPVQPYLARSSFADLTTPPPLVVAAALKRAAAQPPIVLRATLNDPPTLTTAPAIVIAAPFRPARTHPYLSRGSLTAAPAPSGLIGNIGYIGEGPEVGAITQPSGAHSGGNAGMTQSQEVGAVTYAPDRHVIGRID